MDEISRRSTLQRIKTELKQWEREFQIQHGRPPSKHDIQASKVIHSLYREYASTKQQLGIGSSVKERHENKNIAKEGTTTEKLAKNYVFNHSSMKEKLVKERVDNDASFEERLGKENVVNNANMKQTFGKCQSCPALSSNSEDSDATHVSSTPPKQGLIRCDPQLTPVSRFRSVRGPLQEKFLSGNKKTPTSSNLPPLQSAPKVHSVRVSKRKAPGKTDGNAPSHSPSTGTVDTAHEALSSFKNCLPTMEFPRAEGFVIKRHRTGMRLADRDCISSLGVLPAGFSANCEPSSLIRTDRRAHGRSSTETMVSKWDDPAFRDSGGEDLFRDNTNRAPSDWHDTFISRSQFDPPKLADRSIPTTDFVTIDKEIKSKFLPEELGNTPQIKVTGEQTPSFDHDIQQSEKSFQKMSVVTLKQMLLRRGLALIGNKATLISRLRAALFTPKQTGVCSTADNMVEESGKETQIQTTTLMRVRSLKRKSTSMEEENLDVAAETWEVNLAQHSKCSPTITNTEISMEALTTRRSTRSMSVKILPSSFERNVCSSPDLLLPDMSDADKVLAPTSLDRKRKKPFQQTEAAPVVLESASSTGLPPSSTLISADPGPMTYSETVRQSSQDQRLDVQTNKVNRKRAKLHKAPENSWSNPKALRRVSQVPKQRNTINKSSDLKMRSGERNNFVKLNINGKGGRRRKFVNGTRYRRPGAYGRRSFRGKKYRKVDTEDLENYSPLADEDIEVDLTGDSRPFRRVGSGSTGGKSSTWANDDWLAADTPAHDVPSLSEDANCESTRESCAKLEQVVRGAQGNPSNENLLELLHMVFGFKSFRTGQVEAIKRILSLESTMVLLPTGAGKSLCYQLPAYLLPGLTLVISPLVALMTDQLLHLPPSLPGALISSAQTLQESYETISRLRKGQIKVLFISPERLCAESFHRILGDLPKISLAVIDEAHCLSEWSHNFRPSYFRLGNVLQQMKVPCVLAMTATATKKAESSMLKSLCISSADVIQASHVRENLVLSASREPNRLKSLLSLLQRSPFSEARSIIIYCTFQAETDYISGYLHQNGIQAKSYHAKKASQERSRIYDQFCRNKLRVVVATVAFGMGLDKSDVRAIIHYNMPRSLEHYVQETGRAGRDGKPAYCHIFLDDGDYLKLRSLAYSDGVDEYSVGKFLSRVFEDCSDSSKLGQPVSIIIETAAREFDMKEEVMETVLSYLEVGEVQYVKVLSKLSTTCALSFHRSSPASLANRSTLVAAVMKRSQEKQGSYVFDLVSLANSLRLSLSDVQFELRRLQAAGEVMYEYRDPALCFSVMRKPDDICLLASTITGRVTEVEQCKVRKIDAVYTALLAAVKSGEEILSEENHASVSPQQASLQASIKLYFDEDEDTVISDKTPSIIEANRNFLRADIKDFVRSNKHPGLTGRAVARIFYGLWSPAFPYSEWSKNHSWGKYERVDFGAIKEAATAEILLQHANNRMMSNS